MAAVAPTAPAPAPPNPSLILFARGVIARLELWPALRIAVEQNWGGPSSRDKRRWLASSIVDAFDDDDDNNASTPDAEYVALMLAQVLEDEFDASFEDGSVEGVAADIVALWGAGEDVVRQWERKAEGVRGKKVDVREVRGEEDGDENGDEDEDAWEDEESDGEEGGEAPQLMPAAAEVQRLVKPQPVTDEDGFTLVQKGRR